MKKTVFVRNQEGQVLGLPMYLIIVMIVAVAVIAAVIFMIPQGTKTMNAAVSTGSAQLSTGVNADNEATFGVIPVTITVTTNDEQRSPIMGATVRLVGCHVVGEGTTLADGVAAFDVPAGAYLAAGINEGKLKMTVKAPGYEDFEDDSAVVLLRS